MGRYKLKGYQVFLLAMTAAGYYTVYRFPLTLIFVPGLYSVITVPSVKKRILPFGPSEEEKSSWANRGENEMKVWLTVR